MMTTYRGAVVQDERVIRTKGADQRDRVLAAAVDAIAERGPHRVTVRDIASRAGISPSHVLYYFGKRENILMETLRWSEGELSIRRMQELAAADLPRRSSSGSSSCICLLILEMCDGTCGTRSLPPHRALRRPTSSSPTWSRSWVDDLQRILSGGVAAGEFRSVDVPELALRARLLMDGVASEVVMGLPGRTPEWGIDYIGPGWPMSWALS